MTLKELDETATVTNWQTTSPYENANAHRKLGS